MQCDYWRFWSNSKGNAAQHHMAMRQIADFYKYGGPRPGAASAGERLGEGDLGEVEAQRARRSPLVPGLKRLHVWSDGQRSQYKGEKNFGRNAEWPKSIDVGAWNWSYGITFTKVITPAARKTTPARIRGAPPRMAFA